MVYTFLWGVPLMCGIFTHTSAFIFISSHVGDSSLTWTLFLFLKMRAPEKWNSFMDNWWPHCTHSLADGHMPHYCKLELVHDGIRPCHSYCRIALDCQINNERGSETEEILCRANVQYGEQPLFHASVYDWHHTFSTGCKKSLSTAFLCSVNSCVQCE